MTVAILVTIIAVIVIYDRRFSWKAQFRCDTAAFRYLDWPDR